jgi:hypothetical protein
MRVGGGEAGGAVVRGVLTSGYGPPWLPSQGLAGKKTVPGAVFRGEAAHTVHGRTDTRDRVLLAGLVATTVLDSRARTLT